MEEKWTHRHDPAAPHFADHFRYTFFPIVELVVEPTKSVRPGKHAQRAVLETTVIKVHAHGHDVRKNLRGRLHLPHAGLVRPTDVTSDVDPRGD